MPEHRRRTIEYRRVDWDAAPNANFQESLNACLRSLPRVEDTRIEFEPHRAEIRHRNTAPWGTCLHIAAWTPDESAATVPHQPGNNELDLGERPPGDSWDYLDGDGMVLARDNHCLLLASSGLRATALARYLQRLFVKGKL